MLTLRVWNLSALAPVSDYAYDVHVGNEIIASGSVNGHTRDDGWAVLVRKIAQGHIDVAVPIKTKDGRIIGTCQKTAVVACGFLRERDMAICVKPITHTTASLARDRRHKFSRVVAGPARRPR